DPIQSAITPRSSALPMAKALSRNGKKTAARFPASPDFTKSSCTSRLKIPLSSFLTVWTPGGSAASDGSVAKWRTVDWANAVALPPIRLIGSVMKSDATELARIGEHESAFALKENEMIVFAWPIVCRFDSDLAGHAEMNAKPHFAGKFEEHPFAARVRAQKFCAD